MSLSLALNSSMSFLSAVSCAFCAYFYASLGQQRLRLIAFLILVTCLISCLLFALYLNRWIPYLNSNSALLILSTLANLYVTYNYALGLVAVYIVSSLSFQWWTHDRFTVIATISILFCIAMGLSSFLIEVVWNRFDIASSLGFVALFFALIVGSISLCFTLSIVLSKTTRLSQSSISLLKRLGFGLAATIVIGIPNIVKSLPLQIAGLVVAREDYTQNDVINFSTFIGIATSICFGSAPEVKQALKSMVHRSQKTKPPVTPSNAQLLANDSPGSITLAA